MTAGSVGLRPSGKQQWSVLTVICCAVCIVSKAEHTVRMKPSLAIFPLLGHGSNEGSSSLALGASRNCYFNGVQSLQSQPGHHVAQESLLEYKFHHIWLASQLYSPTSACEPRPTCASLTTRGRSVGWLTTYLSKRLASGLAAVRMVSVNALNRKAIYRSDNQ